MVVFDTSVLLLFLDPQAKPPNDPATEETLLHAPKRIEYLIETLSASKDTIIIPTPVLSEVLVYAGGATNKYLEILNNTSVFRIAPFDQKAAIEASVAMKDAIDRGGHRIDTKNPDTTRTKIKFDRQIVAISRAENAHTVYSGDGDVLKYSSASGMNSIATWELELPPEDPQGSFNV